MALAAPKVAGILVEKAWEHCLCHVIADHNIAVRSPDVTFRIAAPCPKDRFEFVICPSPPNSAAKCDRARIERILPVSVRVFNSRSPNLKNK